MHGVVVYTGHDTKLMQVDHIYKVFGRYYFFKKAQSSGHTSNLKPYFLNSFANVVLFYVLM